MTTSSAGLLAQLYGDRVAATLLPRLNSIRSRWRDRLGSGSATSVAVRLTQQDALLITYADQVQEPGVPPLRTLATFAARHLDGVVSGLHILPFYPWSSDDGFSVKDYLAVSPEYGTWDDVRCLGSRFDLMMDAVFNHLSAESDWFRQFISGEPGFRDFFVTVEGSPDLSQVVRPRALPLLTEFSTPSGSRKVWTTFSADQVDLNYRNPEVLFAVLEVLLFYVSQGARFIRLDAIAFLWKIEGTPCLHLPQTHQVIQWFRSVLSEVAPGVFLVTETNVPHADNIGYFGDGSNEAQLVYNFALPPLVVHGLVTGGASRLTEWARTLRVPSDQVTFFNFLASHDGIGVNPVRGILSEAEIAGLVAGTEARGGFISTKRLPDGSEAPYEMNISFLDAVSEPAGREPEEASIRRMVCAHAIQLSLAGVPGIYFHSLVGSRGDRAGAVASGMPRRINREKLELSRLESELAEPGGRRSRVFTAIKDMLRARASRRAFSPSAAQAILDLHEQVFAVERVCRETGNRVLCLHNLGATAVEVHPPGGARSVVLEPWAHRWIDDGP